VLNCGIYTARHGNPLSLFHGFTWSTLPVVLSMASVGIGVSYVLKHADNIMRTFAAACAVSVQYLLFDLLWLHWRFSAPYAAGCGVVFCSVYLWVDGKKSVMQHEITQTEDEAKTIEEGDQQ